MGKFMPYFHLNKMANKNPTEEKILKAAQEVFQNKGFTGARMQEIADRAGINKGLLHYYFTSKETLFKHVFAIALKKMLGKLNEVLEKDVDLYTKIRLIIDNYIFILSKNRFIPNFIFQEINRDPEYFNKIYQFKNNIQSIKKFEEEIKAEVKKGNIIDIPPKQLIINIISMSIFPFMAKPMAKTIFDISDKEFNALIEERRKLVAEFTIQAIKIK